PPGGPATTGSRDRSRGPERLDGEGPRGGASRLLEGGDEGRRRSRQPPGGGRPDGTGGWAREVATPDVREPPSSEVGGDLAGVLGLTLLVRKLPPGNLAADLGERVLRLRGLWLGARLVGEVVDGRPDAHAGPQQPEDGEQILQRHQLQTHVLFSRLAKAPVPPAAQGEAMVQSVQNVRVPFVADEPFI